MFGLLECDNNNDGIYMNAHWCILLKISNVNLFGYIPRYGRCCICVFLQMFMEHFVLLRCFVIYGSVLYV